MFRYLSLCLPLTGLVLASSDRDDIEKDPSRAMSGGDTSVELPRAQAAYRGAFSFPAANLPLTRRGDHFAGNSFFQNPWVTAPASTASRDGLGPVFNTMSCQSCHIKDGRGKPPEEGEPMLSMLIRLSVSDEGANAEDLKRHGVVAHEAYGDQLQTNAVEGVAPEATATIQWTEIAGTYDDGTPYSLRRPSYNLEDLAYGPMPDDIQLSGRVAPTVIGVGLLDAITDETLDRLADPEDSDGDGISGRVNRVWDVAKGAPAHGRFGWKGEQPNVHQQVAAAFRGDIGITSSLFPAESTTALQLESVKAPSGGEPEVSDEILDLVTFYTKTLAVPARRSIEDPVVLDGERLFRSLGCNACHVETLLTGEDPLFPELSNQTIHPFTDLLLHDMGEGLSDGRPVFEAGASEWRTPPLWGVGLVFMVNRHRNLLHDGRARGLEEAILWHGGEAAASRDGFKSLDAKNRRALIAFLQSL